MSFSIPARRPLRRFIGIAPVLAVLLFSPGVRADVPDPVSARQLFEDGKAVAARQDWKNALELFTQSWEASPSYDTAANLGQTALKLDQPEVAARFLSYSLRHFPPSGDRTKREAVAAYLTKASAAVAKISLTVEPAEAGVALDGMRVGTAASLEGELFVTPGDHTIEASSAGYATEKQSITAAKGVPISVALRLRKESASPSESAAPSAAPSTMERVETPPAATAPKAPSPPDHDARPSEGPSVAPLVIESGVFAVALAVGIGFRVSSNSDLNEAHALEADLGGNNSCTGAQPAPRCSDLPSMYDSVNTKRNVSTAGFVSAGVALVAGVATAAYLYWPRHEVRSARFSTRVAPQVGPNAAGFTLIGEF